jgi:O-antigen ligase
MGITKKVNPDNIFLFLFLVLFPFGQVIRIGLLQPIDAVVGLSALYVILKRVERPKFFKYFEIILVVVGFSWLFSVFIFRQTTVFYGLLYFFRLAAYFYFFVYVWNFVKSREINKKLLLNSLLVVSITSAIFGWIQYFTVPSIKPFFSLGWDEHLFRLVGTFLDPPFIGLIIIFGLIISMIRFLEKKSKKMLIIAICLLISLAFTYSRGSYMALLAGLITIGIYKMKIKQVLFMVLGLVLLIIILPTSGNHILGIFRAFSVVARIDNYSRTIQIFKTSPVFGVGYDNLCLAKAQLDGGVNFFYHDCSGSDSSLLLVLATTGITGFIVFVFSIGKIIKSLQHNSYFIILSSSFVALLVHSLFSNSMFYSWIMGYMAILLATAVKERSLE